eukprot:761884-Hanusia_phi.AAC.1
MRGSTLARISDARAGVPVIHWPSDGPFSADRESRTALQSNKTYRLISGSKACRLGAIQSGVQKVRGDVGQA